MATVKAGTALDSSGFERGSKKIIRSVDSIGTRAKSVGNLIGISFGAAALVGFTKRVIDAGSAISDTAVQLSIGIEQLQVLQFAAQEAGVSGDILERSLRNIKQRVQESLDGNERYSKALKRLGLNAEELIKLPLERQFEQIAIATTTSTNASQAFNDVSVILGQRAGPKLTEVLQNVARSYNLLDSAARDAGQVMREDVATSLDAASDELARMGKGLLNIVAGPLVALGRGRIE